MIHETKKIMAGDMNSDTIKVTATCVRIPVPIAHSEEVYFEVEDDKATVDDIREALAQAMNAVGSKAVFVGRIRPDAENPRFFHMWNVSDNLLKGAAWNSMQIAETMDAMGLIQPK